MSKYFVFWKFKKEDPQFLRAFKTMSAANKWIDKDILLMRREYPEKIYKTRFSKNTYFVAKRLK